MSGGSKASEETLGPPGSERRRWKRKDISAEGRMRIIYALGQSRSSRWEKILVNNISTGGIRAEVPYVSWDDLHIVGDLTEPAWMPNVLDIEVEALTGPPQEIFFQGSARWYSRIGDGPDYLIGISISTISQEDREKLLTFLGDEGFI